MNIILGLRIFNIMLAITCITLWIIFYKNNKKIGVIAPLSWLFDFLAFSTWRFFFPGNTLEILIKASWWTALLCTHAIILLLVAVVMNYPNIETRKEIKK